MATLSYTYAAASAPTITLSGLTTGSLRQSDGISAGSVVDRNAVVLIGSPSSSTSATGTVWVYIAVSADNGSNYTGGASGTDSSYTGAVPGPRGNLILAKIIDVIANSTDYRAGFSIASVCGFMPRKYAYVVLNSTGGTLGTSSIAEETVVLTSV